MVKKFWLVVCFFAAIVNTESLTEPILLKSLKCGSSRIYPTLSLCPGLSPGPPVPVPPPCNNCSPPVPVTPPVPVPSPVTVPPPVLVPSPPPPATVPPPVTVSPPFQGPSPCNNCSPSDCSTAPNGASFPYDNHCKLFYQCIGGSAVASVCPNGYWYDRLLSKCMLCELVSNCPANTD